MVKPKQPTLYLIRGLPGSGKTSFAKSLLEAGLVADYFEADKFMVDGSGNYYFNKLNLNLNHNKCQEQVIQALLDGESVAVSNTSTTENEISVYNEMAESTGSLLVSIILENRRGCSSIHDVPDGIMQRMRQRFSIKL